MRDGSAPGQDSLTVTFYKAFGDILLPHLSTPFQEMCENGIMPPTMREALIVTLLKPGKDPHKCSSYRPLSLLNVDTKIYSKILANRLSSLLPTLVGPEQAGFIPGRSLPTNLRTVFGAFQHVKPEINAVAVFLDAEKAFDSILWSGHL